MVNELWNLRLFNELLEGFEGRNKLMKFLAFGFPISHDGITGVTEKCKNWKTALDYPDEVTKQLNKFTSTKAMIGPFKNNPFNRKSFFSPLSTREKKDSPDRRLILDLSHPEGRSVNDGIKADEYLGEEYKVKLPSVWDFAHLVLKTGESCLMYKRDLKAFLQANSSLPLGCTKVGFDSFR